MASVYMMIFIFVIFATIKLGGTQSTGFCDYPTYYDTESDECVFTCPSGTFGNVSRTANVTMRNCSSLSPGYLITFNASEYEFDVNVYSPVGTVVFEALLITENLTELTLVRASFRGIPEEYNHYSLNGMDETVTIDFPFPSNPLLTIALNESLEDDDDEITYDFRIDFFAVTFSSCREAIVNVILHEINPCDNCPSNSTCEPQSDGSAICECPAGYNGTNCANFIGFCHLNPCLNGGTCIETESNFTCTCIPPLTGRFCEVDPIDECDPNPCLNGNCTDLITSYNCTCFDGFTDNDCSTNIDDCFPNPCMNNGTCIDGISIFICNCPSPWTGNVCDFDFIDDCTDVDCNNGTCVDLVNDFQCSCDLGYTGRFCDISVNDCENVTCLNNGTCIDLINSFTCQCSPGYEGTFCSDTTNECDPDPCVDGQGDCEDLFLDYRCNCRPDFTGRNCSARFNDCLSEPCQNNATCLDLFAAYVCECPDGITGNDCETIINQCDPNPCVNNGTCNTLINNYTCTCPIGYTSRNCSELINFCMEVTCFNNGTCINMPSMGTFSCICNDGFTGMNCGDNIDECDAYSYPCENNGTCYDLVNDYMCICLEGYTGKNCSINIDNCIPNPCKNNGTCIDHTDDYICNCLEGFTGSNCSINIDDCNPNPCENNGTCTDFVNDFMCDCVEGYTEKNCSFNIDDCDPDPCENNGTCTDLVNDFMCDCVEGYTKKNCSFNIDDCDPDPCENNGTCTDLVNDFMCDCVEGYTDKNCSFNIDDCDPDPCENGGTCTDLVNDFMCDCVEGYTEKNCSFNIDDCDPDPCENNGTCTDLVSDFMCDCVEGYTEKNCSFNIDDCDPDPCENGGTCTDLVNDFMCDCVEGYTEKNCSFNIDDCDPDPCENNGTCTDLVNDFMCNCVKGYTEKNCSFNIDDCDPDPCENGGTCTDLVNDFMCDCVEGYTEKNCSFNIDDCDPNPCENGGTCTDLVNDFMCDCVEGYAEKNCSFNIDDCDPDPCENGGTCTDLVNDFMCDCVEGYTEKNCSFNIDDCTPNPCENGGSCTDFVSGFICSCVEGFTENNCTINIDDCTPNPCENNGTCIDLVNDYTCNCIDGYIGKNCSVDESNCDPNPCLNEGRCEDMINNYSCVCTSHFTGRNCSIAIDGCPKDIDMWNIEWPSTVAGDTSSQSCPGLQELTATRSCLENGIWSSPDVSNCQSPVYIELEAEVERITSTIVNITTLVMFSSELSDITTTEQAILPQDIVTASNILTMIIESALDVTDANDTEILALSNHTANVLDNLFSDSNNPSFQQLTDQDSSASQLLSSTENIGILLARSLDSSSNESLDTRIERTNIVIDVILPTKEDLMIVDEVVFPEAELNTNNVISQAQITIPGSIILSQLEKEGKRVPVINSFSKNINMLLPNNIRRNSPMGVTISSQISDTSMSQIEFSDNNVVIMYFKTEGLSNNLSATCVFWDYNFGESGGWSTNGVTAKLIDSNTVQCTTTHLTSFSVLVGPSGAEATSDEEALSYISYIGCGISIVCLVLTLIALVVFRNKIFNKIQHFIHFNLSLSLLLGLIIFVAGIETANDNEGGCKFVALLLHYTFLSAFCWMLCEGIVIYILLYFVFYKGFFLNWKFYLAFGYGVPLPILFISFGAAFDEYGTDEICWLSEENGAIWAFIVPMLLIILINIFILIATLWRIYKTAERHLTAEQYKKTKTAKSLIKAAVLLQPLLGSTWIIGLFTVNRNTIAFAYVFTILNALQGVFIFFFYIVRNEKFIILIKTCGKGEKYTTAHTSSHAAGSASTNVRHSSVNETPMKKQKSWADYDVAIRNAYTKEDNEDDDSQKSLDSSNNANKVLKLHNPTAPAQSSENNDGEIKGNVQDDINKEITVALNCKESVSEETEL